MKKRTKVGLVYETIRDRIEDATLGPGTRLASCRLLAEELAVSTQTVKKALSLLKAEGRVEGSRGSGVYVTGKRAASDARVVARSKADEISRVLIDQITDGSVMLGEHLPAPKVLRYRFRASTRTVMYNYPDSGIGMTWRISSRPGRFF